MTMTFIRQRLTSVASRLLLVMGVTVSPLLMFVLASAYWHPAPQTSDVENVSLASVSARTQTVREVLPEGGVRASLAPSSRPAPAPLALNALSVLALAAIGLAAACWLGRRLLVLSPAGGHASAAPDTVTLNATVSNFRSALGAGTVGGGGGGDASGGINGVRPSAPGMALFHQLADALPQMVSIMRADGSRSYVNQRWAEYVGVPQDEILDHRWNRFVHADDMPGMSAVWADAANRGESVEFEYRLLRADGCFRWMLGRAAPLAASGETGSLGARPAEWLVTSTDIDDLRRGAVLLEETVSFKRLLGRMAKIGG